MAIRRILTIDNAADLAILKAVSPPVEGGVTDALRALMDDMLETMYAARASAWPPPRSAS